MLFWVANAMALEPVAMGRWQQIDEDDGKPNSVIQILERDGFFEGVIVSIFSRPGEDLDPVCSKCSDQRKGQRVIGMKILSGFKRMGLAYTDGEILDPDNGQVYRTKMKLSADGKTLVVRGYIGVSLFGRSQIWLREP